MFLAAQESSRIDWGLLFGRFFNTSPVFLLALLATVYISVIAEFLGIILGVITLGASRSRFFPFRWMAWLYRLLLRGTPPIVQIFFIYYGSNLLLGFDLFPTSINFGTFVISGAVLAGITALGLNEGAYMSEIIRGGVDSVDAGQLESALSVGMTRHQAMRRIIAPQAARVIVPTVGNQFNYMLKMTSLLAFIGVYELFQDAQVGYSASFRPIEYFIGVAFWYLVLTSIWGLIQARIEKKLAASELQPSTNESGRMKWAWNRGLRVRFLTERRGEDV